MKAFKILLALVCVAVLTLSVISLNDVNNTSDSPTYKEHKSKDLLAVDKTKKVIIRQS